MSFSVADLMAEAETLPDEWALVLFDRALASGECSARELIDASREKPERLQWLVVIADGRARTAAHSILRRAWYASDMPTPSTGRRLSTPFGAILTACMTEYHRFAVATEGDPQQLAWLARQGWKLVVIPEQKVLGTSISEISEHLRAEHLRHLGTVGLGRRRRGRSA